MDEGFDTLSLKIAASLQRICTGEAARSIQILEEKMAKQGTMLNGRQLSFIVCEHLRLSEQEGAINTYQDLLAVRPYGNNMMAYRNDWESALDGIANVDTLKESGLLEELHRKSLEHFKEF